MERLPDNWRSFLGGRLDAAGLEAILAKVEAARAGGQVFPPAGQVFHALELTAGALVRVLAVNFLRRGEVHIAQRLERTRAALLLRQLRVDSQRLLDLRADAHERVHRGHRLLKDHAELAALDGAQLRAGQA